MHFTLVVSKYKYEISILRNLTFNKWCGTKVAHCTVQKFVEVLLYPLPPFLTVPPRSPMGDHKYTYHRRGLLYFLGHFVDTVQRLDGVYLWLRLPFPHPNSNTTQPMGDHKYTYHRRGLLYFLGHFVDTVNKLVEVFKMFHHFCR